jgi:hypothetical protein
MIELSKRIALGALTAICMFVMTGVASAGSLTWHFRSEYNGTISLEFYGQDRDYVWPGNNEVYVIDDGKVHNYTLSCRTGEKICYGAWVRNHSESYWGSGYDGEQACDSCCYTCNGGETKTMVLNR